MTDRGLILACSAIGAGLAMIAGIGPGVGQGIASPIILIGVSNTGLNKFVMCAIFWYLNPL